MIIAGLDPGLAATGYGVIESKGNVLTPLTWGVIRSGEGELADRLAKLHDRILTILDEYRPEMVAVEAIFSGNNARSALLLGHARGALLLAAAAGERKVLEYPARVIKQAVVGRGAASKEQVRFMVGRILNTPEDKIPFDASDALAAAVCGYLREGRGSG